MRTWTHSPFGILVSPTPILFVYFVCFFLVSFLFVCLPVCSCLRCPPFCSLTASSTNCVLRATCAKSSTSTMVHHLVPLQPGLQLHVNESTPSMHTPVRFVRPAVLFAVIYVGQSHRDLDPTPSAVLLHVRPSLQTSPSSPGLAPSSGNCIATWHRAQTPSKAESASDGFWTMPSVLACDVDAAMEVV